MPVQPLFNADLDTVKARLRLSGVEVGSNADDLIQKALEDVRINLFDENRGLGEATVLALRAVTFVENSLLPAELARTKANNLEITWTRLLLLRKMPMLFMDGSTTTHEMWNEEPLTRAGARQVEAEISRLEDEVISAVADLVSVPTVGIDIFVIEPEITPPRPGDSIKPVLLRGT